jgi:HEAT repeat protein
MVCLAFVAMTAFTLGESGIDALFFDRVGVQALPVTYILQGAASFAVMLVLTGTLGKLGPRRIYLFAPLALAIVLVVERALILTDVRWIYYILWITAGVGMLLLGISVWGVAGAVVDTRQAKRLFPIFGAGGILGSVIGGLLTRPLAGIMGAENLLVVWAAGLVLAFFLARLALGPLAAAAVRRVARRRPSALRSMATAFGSVRRSRLLVWMTCAAVLFSVLFYLLYLPYARAASEHFPRAADLAGFFGLFWAAVTLAAFLVSMFATNRLFARLGVAAVVIVLPLLYAAAFGVLLVVSGFVQLVALRFVLGTWLQGVASPAWETLINVVPESRRDQTRAFLNGGPTQVGTMLAGVLALVGQNALSSRQFALVGLVVVACTTIAALGIRRTYTGALVDALREGRPQVFERSPVRQAPIAMSVDADAARALGRSMRSSDVRERRLAFQLAAELPAEVRPPEVAEGVRDEDPMVRLASVRTLDASASDRDRLLPLVNDRDPTVAAAAAAQALWVESGEEEALTRIRELLAHEDPRVRRAAIEQLAVAPASQAAALASEALRDSVPEVRAAALERLAAAAPAQAVDRARADLRDPNPAVRLAAGRALGSAGGDVIDDVLNALCGRETADAAIEAVRRLELDGHGDRVRTFIRSAADLASRDGDLAASIPTGDEAVGLLRDAILDRARRTARAGLWAATLLGGRRAELEMAIQNLDGPPQMVATALEALETADDPKLLRALLASWEPASFSARHDDWLPFALADEDEFIRRCANLVRARLQGGTVAHTTLSTIERVLFLHKVPLFAAVSPEDLERVAELVEERGYADGEVIASEGEIGDELYIVVEGIIRVVQDRDRTEHGLARRGAGDVVGGLSLLRKAPRIASLVAEGAVRTICLRYRDVESVLRERPEIAMAAMRVLATRLAEASGEQV